jgi:hypothetical protein
MKIDELRVGYILPGHESPVDEVEAAYGTVEDSEPSFFDRLHSLEVPKLGDWRQLLGLTQEPPSLTTIGPPPRPVGRKPSGTIQDQTEWRTFLSRYRNTRRLTGESHRVQKMVDVLSRMEQWKEIVRARGLEGRVE